MRQILINVEPYERRIAITRKNALEEFHIERTDYQRLAGNIYKGVIDSVVPGIGALFVDLGTGKNGFLYIDDFEKKSSQTLLDEEIVVEKRGGPRARSKEGPKKGQEVLVQVVKEPLGKKGGTALWFDVAHNPASAQAVHDFFIERPGKKCLIFALLKSKDARETLRPLVQGFDQLIFFTPDGSERYHPAEFLAQISQSLGGKSNVKMNFKEALEKALSLSPTDLLIAGSHYFSAELSGLFPVKKQAV